MSADHNDERTRPELGQDLGTHAHVLAIWEGGSASCWLPIDGELTLGRAVENDVSIDHGSVSRRHARLVGGSPVTIVDLGSSNGIRIRGERVAKHGSAPIYPGDVVELGSAVIVVQQAIKTPSSPAPDAARDRLALGERLIERVAPTDVSVLLTGETGVGKNVTAARIHHASTRASASFVKVDCAALPDTLLEAELFGYERGAFTGAQTAKPGLLESADGGTVFLDEIGELQPGTQAKLLSVLESREVQRLGRLRPVKIDVRFVAATNRDLRKECEAGRFRTDLYYRLSAVTIAIPSLRDRAHDIPDLARRFLEEACERWKRSPLALDEAALPWLQSQPWPGNIRELKHAVERAALIADGDVVRLADFEAHIVAGSVQPHAVEPAHVPPEPRGRPLQDELDGMERQRILEALEASAGNQTLAAQKLGISRRSLIHRLEQHDLPRPRKRRP